MHFKAFILLRLAVSITFKPDSSHNPLLLALHHLHHALAHCSLPSQDASIKALRSTDMHADIACY